MGLNQKNPNSTKLEKSVLLDDSLKFAGALKGMHNQRGSIKCLHSAFLRGDIKCTM